MTEATTFSKTTRTAIDKWIAKYPADQKQSAVMAALSIVQEENKGYLTEALIEAVADYLGMPHIAVFEVATFYSMYELSPVGKHKISVCGSISCELSGASNIVEYLKNKLNIAVGETTADGKFTLKMAECLAACSNAPMMQINKEYYYDLTPEKIDTILEALG